MDYTESPDGAFQAWDRLVPTKALRNFRDMGNYTTMDGESTVLIGQLFRSANPAEATVEDADVWLNHKNIDTWIDFRSKEEVALADNLKDHYDTVLITRTGELKDISKAKIPGSRRRIHYTVDLDYVGAVKRFFQKHATIFEKLCMLVVATLLKHFWPTGPLVVVRMFYGRVGLHGLYLTFLEECQPQLARALKILAEAPEGASLVNCMLGKDRTGTISALALLALGVPAERVSFDYALTETCLTREYISNLLKPHNLDSEVLASSKKGTMSQMITHLIVKHGSVEQYLDKIGFDAKWRSKLQARYNRPVTVAVVAN